MLPPKTEPVLVVDGVHATGRVIWITGPRCAGASRIGWEIARTLWGSGERTGFIDVAQLGFAWNSTRVSGTVNAAVLQDLFAETGAETLVAVAPFEVTPADIRAAFPQSDVTFFRLDADDRTRRDSAFRRARGAGGALLAGDDLIGASSDAVDQIIAVGARQRAVPLRDGEILVDVTTPSLPQTVARLMALSALPD